MPANDRDYSFFDEWAKEHGNELHSIYVPISPRSTPSTSRNSSPMFPSSPVGSPTFTSPYPPLRRNFSSTFTLIPEDREVNIVSRPRDPKEDDDSEDEDDSSSLLTRMILYCPKFAMRICLLLLGYTLRFIFSPFSFATPSFWLSALLWIFWKIIGFPIMIIKWMFSSTTDESIDGKLNGNQRTVLISCGSTIQTLHLARNFYSSGARVVVFEFEGLFGLARFSTAVSKFYTIPKPAVDSLDDYITALCDIIEMEKPTYYVPVCATSPAYFDALAKPHLELLGCATFLPGLQENTILDDTLEIFKKCQANDIPLPPFKLLSSKEDLFKTYASGFLNGYRNIMIAVGLQGLLERQKYIVPNNSRDFKLNHEISEEKQWILIRDVPGEHYVTCTTIKDSRVIANVTCLVNQDTKTLIPEENKAIEKWLTNFFVKVRFHRNINGHISFRFVKDQVTGNILPLGSRVGVSLPYICYTGVHSRVLWKPCPHFSRFSSGPLVEEGGRYWIHEIILNTLKHPSINAVGQLIGTVLDKREALFAYWDPLPYCAYYHFQLPLKSVKVFLQKRQRQTAKRVTTRMTVHPVE